MLFLDKERERERERERIDVINDCLPMVDLSPEYMFKNLLCFFEAYVETKCSKIS